MYEDWPTLQQAIEMTGLSESTLQRMIRKREIQREYRPNRGRKDLIILDPIKVQELRTRSRHPVPDTQSTALTPQASANPVKVSVPSIMPSSDLKELLTVLRRPQLRLSEKLLLTTAEASTFSGLSEGHLRDAARENQLPALGRRPYRFRPADLRRYVDALVDGVKAVNEGVRGITAGKADDANSDGPAHW
jgi:helix-turn-helix protein